MALNHLAKITVVAVHNNVNKVAALVSDHLMVPDNIWVGEANNDVQLKVYGPHDIIVQPTNLYFLHNKVGIARNEVDRTEDACVQLSIHALPQVIQSKFRHIWAPYDRAGRAIVFAGHDSIIVF